MKKTMWLTILLSIAMLASTVLSGCTPAAIVVGKVGNESITTKDVDLNASFLLMRQGITRADITDAAMMKSLNESALDMAITYKLILQKGAEMKYYPLSQTDKTEVDSTVKAYIDKRLQTLVTTYTDKAKTDPSIDPQKAAQKELDAMLKSEGLTTENLTQIVTQSKVAQYLMTDANKNVTATDADVKAKYDEMVASQKESYTKDASVYETALNDGATLIAYKPEGYRYVKHILIAFPSDISTQISAAMKSGDANKVKTLRDDGLPKIKAKADEALTKVQSGEDFDSLITTYGEDPGMKQEPASKTGYPLGAASSFVPEFKDAAMKLGKIGDTTGLVATDFGYHIIKWVADVPSGPVPFADLKAALQTELLKTKQNDNWNATMEKWKTETKIEKYPEKIPVVLPSTKAPSAT